MIGYMAWCWMGGEDGPGRELIRRWIPLVSGRSPSPPLLFSYPYLFLVITSHRLHGVARLEVLTRPQASKFTNAIHRLVHIDHGLMYGCSLLDPPTCMLASTRIPTGPQDGHYVPPWYRLTAACSSRLRSILGLLDTTRQDPAFFPQPSGRRHSTEDQGRHLFSKLE